MADVWRHCWCCARWKNSRVRAIQKRRSKEIDRMLQEEDYASEWQVKILLLGADESGKSTFLKQMKIIHGDSFDSESVVQYKSTIYQNTIKGMKVLVNARHKLGIRWENPESAKYADHILMYDDSMYLDLITFQDFADSIQELWKDQAIKSVYDRRREFQLSDNVCYYFESLSILASPNYLPSHLDILHSREATTGVSEYLIKMHGISFRFLDVGAQHCQRQKLMQCFEDVYCIIFMVSSSEFDQVLLEDGTTNRIVESRNIFDCIINSRYFSLVPVFLLMNKTDLLQEKLSRHDVDIREYFPEFKGDPFDVETVQLFFVDMFESIRKDRRKPFYYHFTTAINTENIKMVFSAMKETIRHSGGCVFLW